MRDSMIERLIAAEYNGKKDKNNTCKSALEKLNRSDDNCPIVLEKMNFNIFKIICQPIRVRSPGDTSLLPDIVGSEVTSLIYIVLVTRL